MNWNNDLEEDKPVSYIRYAKQIALPGVHVPNSNESKM